MGRPDPWVTLRTNEMHHMHITRLLIGPTVGCLLKSASRNKYGVLI